jgi:hypothetical protein
MRYFLEHKSLESGSSQDRYCLWESVCQALAQLAVTKEQRSANFHCG